MQDGSSTRFIADQAPTDARFTEYDERHMAVYLTLLFSDGEGKSEAEMAQLLFSSVDMKEPDQALAAVRSHLARARWLATEGRHYILGFE